MDHSYYVKSSKHSAIFYTNNFITSLCTAYQPILPTICIMDNCPICEKNVLQHEKILFCSCCCKYTHRNCSGLSKAQYEYVRFDTSWYGKKCIEEIFPFNHIDDECNFLRAISEISVSSDIIVRYHSECKIFNPFEINEDNSNILEYHGDLDPDKCFFNQHSHSLLEACNY